MKSHTDSDKHPKRVEFPHDEENDFEISYMQRFRKIKNIFIFLDLVEEASISKHDIQKVLPPPKPVTQTKRLCGVFKSTEEMSLV